MEQFTYIYKQGALCGTARAARTIGPRPSAGYGYPEKTAGVTCRRRACPRSSHSARNHPLPLPNLPACPSRDECLLRSGQILGKTLPVVLRLIWAFRPLSHRRQQTAERAAAPTGHPDPESGRSTARKQKTADGAVAMAATELRRRQKRRLHPKRCENHTSCRKAKFFSYFCAIIIGKR